MSWTRRNLIKAGTLVGGGAILGGPLWRRLVDGSRPRDIPVRMLGASSSEGHKIRDGFQFPPPATSQETDVLVVGGGMAGLSAGWRLQKCSDVNFRILEMECEVGGNSRYGENSISKFPWGAHYVTLLNDEASAARELYEDLGIITGARNGEPVYNEYYLCAAPHERLFIYQKWQDGLLPKVGLEPGDREQAQAFFSEMERLRLQKGADGKFAFSIPLACSSKDPRFTDLDRLTMAEYMKQRGWTSKPLNWYVNYCCRDDYGTPHTQASAWAGLHYFCSRRGRGDGLDGSAVLTWPEGNGWIAARLRERLEPNIVSRSMAFRIHQSGHGVEVDVWSGEENRTVRWRAKAAILAVPRFLAPRLSEGLAASQAAITNEISYSPWMVANLTLTPPLASKEGAPLSWDNVFYEGDSLGYVVATHQRPSIYTGKSVWTYYRPLDHADPKEARKQALSTSAEEWKAMILRDLMPAHPEIASNIESIDVWLWGHAMVRPTSGFIWGKARARMAEPAGRVHFAHSDMSGISIFEEAHFQGVRAADEVLRHGLG